MKNTTIIISVIAALLLCALASTATMAHNTGFPFDVNPAAVDTSKIEPLPAGGPPPGGRYSTCCNYSDMLACKNHPVDPHFTPNTCQYYESITGISCKTREYFMEKTLEALIQDRGTICPANPYGAMIVNHTKGPEIEDAEIICVGANQVRNKAVAYHGEMVALLNCTEKLVERYGPGVITDHRIWQQLTLYAMGEPCPMDTLAFRFARIGEIVWSVSYMESELTGFKQPALGAEDVQRSTNHCPFGFALEPNEYGGNPLTKYTSFQTRIIEYVAHDKILPYFPWRNNPGAPCPPRCVREAGSDLCVPRTQEQPPSTCAKPPCKKGCDKPPCKN